MPSNYDRVMNPYMPSGIADNTNSPTPMFAPGELGTAFQDANTGNTYLRVLLDSGATSATTVGAVKANQLAFWKDRVNNIVTNDPNFNDTGTPASAINRVAGVFRTIVTAAPGVNNVQGFPVQYYCDILIAGKNVPVLAVQGATLIPGCAVIADGVTAGSKTVATTTTAPTQQVLGYARSSTVLANNTFLADITIGFIV